MLAAAAAVLCAVICAAGCINSAADDEADVLGTWYHGDDKLEVFMTFADDGRGIICCLKDDNGTLKLNVPLPYVNDIFWAAEGDTIYLLFDNGAETSYTFDETTGKLTSQKFGIVYEPVEPTDEEDGVAAVWYYETNEYAEIAVDMDDNTGIEYLLEQEKDKDGNVTGKLTGKTILYTWELNDDGTYDIVKEDGTVLHSALDAQKQSVTNSSGKEFSGMPSTGAAFIKLISWSADRLFPYEDKTT